MKIIHCLNQYMPMAMAGTEIYAHALATMQKKAGHDVSVVTPHIEHYRPGQINSHYDYEGIDVYQYLETGDPTDRLIHYGKKKPAGLSNFENLLVTLKPDIVNFHELNRSVGFTIEQVKLAKDYGAKVFLTVHLSSYTCNTNILIRNSKLCGGKIREHACTVCCYKTLFQIPSMLAGPLALFSILSDKTGLLRKMKPGKFTTLLMVPSNILRVKNDLSELTVYVDQFILHASWYKKILLKNRVPESKITVVPAALVVNQNKEHHLNAQKAGLPVRLVCIGRIQPTKGIHIIIEAMRSFTDQKVTVDFYGRKEETDYYEKCLADSKGLNNITWKGSLQRNEVVDTLSRYDMLCLASTFSEMSPLVIQEAFAAGIPVLASKVYGNIEHVKKGGNGMLFEFNSAKSLKEKIQILIENPGLIQQMKGSIKSPLSFNEINEAYLQIYNTF